MILEIFQIRLQEIDEDLGHANVCLSLAQVAGLSIQEIVLIKNMAKFLQVEYTEIIFKIALMISQVTNQSRW
jgi:hypothetical protein